MSLLLVLVIMLLLLKLVWLCDNVIILVVLLMLYNFQTHWNVSWYMFYTDLVKVVVKPKNVLFKEIIICIVTYY